MSQADEDAALSKEAKMIPQFDVPEQLTQRVMHAVVQEHSQGSLSARRRIGLSLAATACGVIALWVSADSPAGVMSWCIGLLMLCGFKLLFESADTQETAS